MNSLISHITQRIQELEKREKLAILAVSAFLAFLTFILVVWFPVYEYREKQRSSYEESLDLSYIFSLPRKKGLSKKDEAKRMSGQTL